MIQDSTNASSLIYGLSNTNLPVYVDIEKLVEEIGYGQVVVTLTVHSKKITDLMTVEKRRKRYDASASPT